MHNRWGAVPKAQSGHFARPCSICISPDYPVGWNDQSQPAQASREVAFGSRQDKPQWYQRFRRDIRDELVWHLAIVTRLKRTDKKDRLRGARRMSARVVRALLGGAPHVDQYQASLFIICGVRKRTTANLGGLCYAWGRASVRATETRSDGGAGIIYHRNEIQTKTERSCQTGNPHAGHEGSPFAE